MRLLDGITDSMDMNLETLGVWEGLPLERDCLHLGDGEGQGTLVCCTPWGLKESYTTWGMSNSNKKTISLIFHSVVF